MGERNLVMVPGPINVPTRVMEAMIKPMVSHRESAFRTLYKGIVENLASQLQKRFERHRICSEALYNAIEALNSKALPERKDRPHTVIAVRKPAKASNAKVRRLVKEHYKVVIAGGAGKLRNEIFRIGCTGMISEAEVVQTVSALENSLIETGFPLRAGAGIEAARRRFGSEFQHHFL